MTTPLLEEHGDILITCPGCGAANTRMTIRFNILSHHAGVAGSPPIKITDPRACQTPLKRSDDIWQMLIMRDIFESENSK